jgi:hypothetical protein
MAPGVHPPDETGAGKWVVSLQEDFEGQGSRVGRLHEGVRLLTELLEKVPGGLGGEPGEEEEQGGEDQGRADQEHGFPEGRTGMRKLSRK